MKSDLSRYLNECEAAAYPKPVKWKSEHLEMKLEAEPRDGKVLYWFKFNPPSAACKEWECRHFSTREAFMGFLGDLHNALSNALLPKSDEQHALEMVDDEYAHVVETAHADLAGK